MKTKTMRQIVSCAVVLLLALVLSAPLAYAQCGGSSDSSSSGSTSGGGRDNKSTKEANSSVRTTDKVVDKVKDLVGASSAGGDSVDLSKVGAAVTAMPGLAPTTTKGVSDSDKARLDGVSVNKSAPVPTPLQ